jgi:hypothetical protein
VESRYAAYKRSLGNGGGVESTIIGLKEEGPNSGALPCRPRDHKATNANLKPDAFALALSETMKTLMVEKDEALAKRDEKRHREKEATCASFMDLRKRTLEIQAIEVEDKLIADKNRIIFADLSLMEPEQIAWFQKKQAIACQRDA